MPPKRNNKRPASAMADSAAANSHDASGADAAGDSRKEQKTMDPPSKRTRANSSATAVTNGKMEASPHLHMPFIIRLANDLQVKTGSKVEMPKGAADGAGEHGEAGTMRMEAPPKAGAVDPEGGYKTNKPPTDRPVRVYADGVFDLFHLGHMRQLQQAKTAFPDTYLIVGVTGDTETHTRKGLTVMSGKERAESLRHCRWVDEVIEDCPWIIDMAFLKKHDIDYVAHDDIPYGASEGDDIYKPIKEQGMFLVTQRTEGVSTTGIITKIVRDYEQYVGRQLKRGTSRQELNISWLKKNELDIKRHVNELRENIRTNWTTTGQELGKELRQFWQPSRPNSPAPSTLRGNVAGRLSATSPLAAEGSARSSTPSRRAGNMDFAAGYAMGLIGGVKGWMEGSKRRNLSDSRAQSPDDSPEERSPIEEPGERRGRQREGKEERVLDQVHS